MIGNSPVVLNFNPLFLKLNRFIYLQLTVGSPRSQVMVHHHIYHQVPMLISDHLSTDFKTLKSFACGIQNIHALVRWNPLSTANENHLKTFVDLIRLF